jgi:hypothetical protein
VRTGGRETLTTVTLFFHRMEAALLPLRAESSVRAVSDGSGTMRPVTGIAHSCDGHSQIRESLLSVSL